LFRPSGERLAVGEAASRAVFDGQDDELGWDLTRLADTTITVGTQKTEGLAAFHETRVAADRSPGADLLHDAALLFPRGCKRGLSQGAERSEGHVRPW
jgi:hypothetical protein